MAGMGKLLKDPRFEHLLFQRRALLGFLVIVLALVGLALRFYWLQVLSHDEFRARADSNRVLTRPLAPARGLIYDRNGMLLAENVVAFRLELTPEQADNLQQTLDELATVVPLSDDDFARFHALRKGKRPFHSIPLRLKLSEEEIAHFAVNRWRFPGVDVVPYLTRFYPHGSDLAHVTGYVGRIDGNDLARLDGSRYEGTTHVGKTGIERTYEDLLHGQPGYEKVEVNADNRPLRVLDRVAPIPGKNLRLSLDLDLQRTAVDAFGDEPGAGVAIDPRNGQVLALVSVPSFDPNLFVNGISHADYSALLEHPDNPLLNRALRGGYPPGSTIKPFVGLAGLELGQRRASDTVWSTGEFFIPGQSRGYRDDKRGGHGRVDLVEAIAQSVNTYFYSLALEMGITPLSDYLARFGFGAPTGVDLPAESAGVLPSVPWKSGNIGEPWYPGETVIAGIGQGYWVVTPIQLTQATATLAAQGQAYAPRLLMSVEDSGSRERTAIANPPVDSGAVSSPENYQAVLDGMIAVVHGPRGTARAQAQNFPYLIAGKTGTAERVSRTTSDWGVDRHDLQRHRVLFNAFTPAHAPEIAIAVVRERGTWGSTDAAPIVRKMFEQWRLGRDGALPEEEP